MRSVYFAAGPYQTFRGLRVEAPKGVLAHSPLVEIEQAAFVLFQGLRVAVHAFFEGGDIKAAVRVRNLTKCKFIGGSIRGGGESGTVGLWLTESTPGDSGTSAYEVGAIGLHVEDFGWGVRVGSTCDDPSFVACRFSGNVDGAVIIASDGDAYPTATTLRLIACRMAGGSPGQYVQTDAPSYWLGGTVLGCTFGARAGRVVEADQAAAAKAGRFGAPGTSSRSGVGQAAVGRQQSPVEGQRSRTVIAYPGPLTPADCIFRINGKVSGIVVSGCSSGDSDSAGVVWHLADSATVTRTCDMFNRWAEATVVTGSRASHLVQFRADTSGQLKVGASMVGLTAPLLGFFDGAPVGLSGAYTVSGSAGRFDRVLRRGNAQLVLGQLVSELAELGLVQRS